MGVPWTTGRSCRCLVLGHHGTGSWELLAKCQCPRGIKDSRFSIFGLGSQALVPPLLRAGQPEALALLVLSVKLCPHDCFFFLEPASHSLVDLILSLQATGPCHIHFQVSAQALS